MLKRYLLTDEVKSSAANEKYLAFSCMYGFLSICRKHNENSPVYSEAMPTSRTEKDPECRTTQMDLTFINHDLLMVTTDVEGLFFYHITQDNWTGPLVAKGQRNLYKSSVMPDGRICTTGDLAFCGIFSLPPSISTVKRVAASKTARSKKANKKVTKP